MADAPRPIAAGPSNVPTDNRYPRFGEWGGAPHDTDLHYTDVLCDTLLANLPLPHHRPGKKDDHWQEFVDKLRKVPEIAESFKPKAFGYQKLRDYVVGRKVKGEWETKGLLQWDTEEFGVKDKDWEQESVDFHHQLLDKITALQSLNKDASDKVEQAKEASKHETLRGQRLDTLGRLCMQEGRASTVRKTAQGEFELDFGDPATQAWRAYEEGDQIEPPPLILEGDVESPTERADSRDARQTVSGKRKSRDYLQVANGLKHSVAQLAATRTEAAKSKLEQEKLKAQQEESRRLTAQLELEREQLKRDDEALARAERIEAHTAQMDQLREAVASNERTIKSLLDYLKSRV